MDLINNLSVGFGVAFTATNLLYCLIGCVLGTLIGILPGLGPVACAGHGSVFKPRPRHQSRSAAGRAQRRL